MIPPDLLAKAKRMLSEAKRPIFFHDDDTDGTASFVICYQFCKQNGEGKGIPVKRSPGVGKEFLRYAEEFGADLIVILDKPQVSTEFFEGTRLPVLWIDHHGPQQVPPNVLYLNPRIWDDADDRPTSYWAYTITRTNLWLATVGCIADMQVPDFIDEFKRQYPDLVTPYEKPEDLYLSDKIGRIIRVIQFNLKGMTSESKKSVLTLTRISSPYEILLQSSSKGRFLWKKYEQLAVGYDKLLTLAMEAAKRPGKLLAFLYEDDSMTYTSELSNELSIRYPKRVVLVARKHDGSYKGSARSKTVPLPDILHESLKGLEGYGGGHELACGLVVAEKDWETFLERFRKGIETN